MDGIYGGCWIFKNAQVGQQTLTAVPHKPKDHWNPRPILDLKLQGTIQDNIPDTNIAFMEVHASPGTWPFNYAIRVKLCECSTYRLYPREPLPGLSVFIKNGPMEVRYWEKFFTFQFTICSNNTDIGLFFCMNGTFDLEQMKGPKDGANDQKIVHDGLK